MASLLYAYPPKLFKKTKVNQMRKTQTPNT